MLRSPSRSRGCVRHHTINRATPGERVRRIDDRARPRAPSVVPTRARIREIVLARDAGREGPSNVALASEGILLEVLEVAVPALDLIEIAHRNGIVGER